MTKFGKKTAAFIKNLQREYDNLYIHVPFCRSKCGYCAFYSETGEKASRTYQEKWLEKVAADLGRYKFAKPMDTIYFGGGTPTFLDAGILQNLVILCRKLLLIDDNTEITMEANPSSLTKEKLDIMTGFITRISLGVQSFSAEKRKKLHRNCTDEDIAFAVAESEKRFKHMNIDLIYGLEDETLESWQKELDSAVACGCDHVSCYELTPEDVAEENYKTFSNDKAANFWLFTGDHLEKSGIQRYEVSNYARPDGRCRHNMNVWNGNLLCGIGPAASGFNGVTRWLERADINAWLNHIPPAIDELAGIERSVEIITLGLRRTDGWQRKEIRERFGKRLEQNLLKMHKYVPEILLVDEERIWLCKEGLLVWDAAVQLLSGFVENSGIYLK